MIALALSERSEINVTNKVKIAGDIAFNTEVFEDCTVTIKAVPSIGEKSFTEAEPVIFAGTIEYHVVVKVNTQAGEEESVFGANVSPLWEQRATVSRLDWNDNRILGNIVQTGKYSTQYKVYTFPVTGTQTLKYRFKTDVVTHNIFQLCRCH